MSANYSRRKFLGTTARALVAAGSLTALPKDLQARIQSDNEDGVFEKGLSILQGLTTETTTQLSVDVPADFPVHYRLVDFTQGRSIHPMDTQRATRSFSSWAVDQISFDDLELGISYLFQVLDENNKIIDERVLRTVDLSNREARLALLSCMMDFNPFQKSIWENVSESRPDYCFFIGDNVYGDIGGFKVGPELLWRRYIETRRTLPFYKMRELIPVLALWDDHDFGKNNANHRYKHKADALNVFNSFFPRRPIEGVYEHGPGCSSIFKAFNHDFVFLDNRYHRDEKSRVGKKGFWGDSQVSWVQSKIANSRRPKWYLQGSQFFGNYLGKGQSFEGKDYEAEFDHVLSMIRATNSPSLFLSGDVHFSEVMDIERDKAGYRTYELTASHMHSFTSLSKSKNRRRRRVVKEANFITVDLINAAYGALYEVQSIRRTSGIAFRDFLQIY